MSHDTIRGNQRWWGWGAWRRCPPDPSPSLAVGGAAFFVGAFSRLISDCIMYPTRRIKVLLCACAAGPKPSSHHRDASHGTQTQTQTQTQNTSPGGLCGLVYPDLEFRGGAHAAIAMPRCRISGRAAAVVDEGRALSPQVTKQTVKNQVATGLISAEVGFSSLPILQLFYF